MLTPWRYHSRDAAGNLETAHTAALTIDTRGPRTTALTETKVRAGKVARFRFRVNDLTPRVRVTIVITRKGHTKKRIVVGSRATGTVLTFRWRCSLPRGQYGWTVTAVDQAANKQSRVLSNRIIVT